MDIDVKYVIIRKLARRHYFASKLINYSDLIRSVAPHLVGEAKIAVKELFKQGFLNRKPGAKSEFRYSLKSELKGKIEKILKRGYF